MPASLALLLVAACCGCASVLGAPAVAVVVHMPESSFPHLPTAPTSTATTPTSAPVTAQQSPVAKSLLDKYAARALASFDNELGMFVSQTLGDPTGPLDGFFVRPCASLGQTSDGRALSMFQTRFYSGAAGSYQVDMTYYVGDSTCKPANSDVYYKLVLSGNVQNKGPNPNMPGVSMSELDWTNVTILVDDNSWGQSLVAVLNQNCPCNGKWEVNVLRNVSTASCKKPYNPSAFYLCNVIGGNAEYYNFQWVDALHYITSVDCFGDSATCYKNPVNKDYVREKIPSSGNNNPSECDSILWSTCGAGIHQAAENCESCLGLECDGCLFRELNPNWNPLVAQDDYNDWYQCCPCIYKYAQQYGIDWLSTKC